MFKKLLDRQVPLSFVLLLNNCNLHCAVRRVRWNKTIGEWFPILCGVRDGGVLSPYLFAVYIDDTIVNLRESGYGIKTGKLFVGCIHYADDVVLLSFTEFTEAIYAGHRWH